MAHNALIFYAYFHLKQHNVHEQALLCRGWMSTSLLSHQFPLPETLNRQHLFFCVSWHFTAGFLSARSLALSPLIWFVSLSVVSPSPPLSFHFTHYCHLSLPSVSAAPFTRSPLFSSLSGPSTCFFCLFLPFISYILILTITSDQSLTSLFFTLKLTLSSLLTPACHSHYLIYLPSLSLTILLFLLLLLFLVLHVFFIL